MKDVNIEGIGSIYGGEYENITIDGISKLKGGAIAKAITIDGIFKAKGKIVTDEFNCDGVARFFRNIEAKTVKVDGLLKLRRASLYADNIQCDGILVCTGEVSADNINIHGACSVSEMYGDKIKIKNNEKSIDESQIPKKLISMSSLYFGRKLSPKHSLIDIIECTHLEASGIKAKVVKAQSVNLRGNCIIDTLDCTGEMIIDDTCRIGKIISGNKPKGRVQEMKETNLIKILDLYKDGKLTSDQAETMIGSVKEIETPAVSWEDDGKLRVVAYIGRRLLKKGDTGTNRIIVEYQGDALDVESYGSLSCGNINGDANAGNSINCGNIEGDVKCGGSVTCGDIGGDLSCGGSVQCKNTKGNITAGGGVHMGGGKVGKE